MAAALLPALACSVHAQAPGADNASAAPTTTPSGAAQPSPAPAPPAQHHTGHFPKIGIDLGAFFPTDSKTRNRFGSVWTSVGLGIGSADAPPSAGRFTLDVSFTSETNGNNYAYVVPVGVAYRRAFSAASAESGQFFVQYYGVSLDAVGVDLRSQQDNVHPGVELTGGGSLTLGTTVGKSAFVEARYSEIAKVEGFDLSGLGLTVGVRF